MQNAINHACRDVNGDANNNLTIANYIWMLVGALFGVLGLLATWSLLFRDIK